MEMSTYEDLMTSILEVQKKIIGEGIAIRLAREVKGLEISYEGKVISYKGEPVKLIKKLVEQYKKVEKDVAITLAKKAISPIIKENPKLKVPSHLQ